MRAPFHVLVLPSWYPIHAHDTGGIFFREQAIALAKARLKVGVVAPQRLSLRNLGERLTRLPPLESLHEVLARYVGFPRNAPLDAILWRRIARHLYRQYVEQHGVPDIIHAHSLFPAGLLAVHLPAKAHVLTEHSTGLLGPQAQRILAPHSSSLRRFSRRIAVSQHFATHLERLAPNGGGWLYVPNVVDVSFFTPREVSGGGLRVLSISNLTPTKRVDVLIRAFDEAFPESDAVLLIGGRGEQRRELEALANSLPSGPRIRFLGPLSREQVRDEMGKCSFFALTSRHETFGVVLIEALAMGKPVLATDSGGPASIVNSQNGIVVPVNDEKALASAMQRLATSLPDYSRSAIRLDCVERFGERTVVSQLTHLYDEVLSS